MTRKNMTRKNMTRKNMTRKKGGTEVTLPQHYQQQMKIGLLRYVILSKYLIIFLLLFLLVLITFKNK